MQVQRGEHIKKAKGQVRLKEEAAQQEREVKKISKRDADFEDEYYSDEYEYEYDYEEEEEEEYYYYDEEERAGFPFQLLEEEEKEEEGGVISFNDIETECPVGTICVESFFCAEFSGNSVSDQIVKQNLILILTKIISLASSPV